MMFLSPRCMHISTQVAIESLDVDRAPFITDQVKKYVKSIQEFALRVAIATACDHDLFRASHQDWSYGSSASAQLALRLDRTGIADFQRTTFEELVNHRYTISDIYRDSDISGLLTQHIGLPSQLRATLTVHVDSTNDKQSVDEIFWTYRIEKFETDPETGIFGKTLVSRVSSHWTTFEALDLSSQSVIQYDHKIYHR
jgi:hypothetical protein